MSVVYVVSGFMDMLRLVMRWVMIGLFVLLVREMNFLWLVLGVVM